MLNKTQGFIPLVLIAVIGLLVAGGVGYAVVSSKPEKEVVIRQEVSEQEIQDEADQVDEKERSDDSEAKDVESVLEKKFEINTQSAVNMPITVPTQVLEEDDSIEQVSDGLSKVTYNQVLKELSVLNEGFKLVDERISEQQKTASQNASLCKDKYESDVEYVNSQYDSERTQILESRTGFATPQVQLNALEDDREYELESLEYERDSCLAQYSFDGSLKGKISAYRGEAKKIEASLTLGNAAEMLDRVRELMDKTLEAVR